MTEFQSTDADVSEVRRRRAIFFQAIESYENLQGDASRRAEILLAEVQREREESAVLRDTISHHETDIVNLGLSITEIRASASWRVTRPLRVVAYVFRRLTQRS